MDLYYCHEVHVFHPKEMIEKLLFRRFEIIKFLKLKVLYLQFS